MTLPIVEKQAENEEKSCVPQSIITRKSSLIERKLKIKQIVRLP